MSLTKSESKHVGQRPRCVENDMELAGLEDNVPYCGVLAKRPFDTRGIKH